MRERFGCRANGNDSLAAHRNRHRNNRVNVGPPVEVGLDADQAYHVAPSRVAVGRRTTSLENKLICWPDDFSDVIIDGDMRSLLREVVEWVWVNSPHDDSVVSAREGVDRLRRSASDIEPPFEANQHDRAIERAHVAHPETQHIDCLHPCNLLA
jgi:hypothetical protein